MKKSISTQWIDNFLSEDDYEEIVELGHECHMYESREYADKYGDSNSKNPMMNFAWNGWIGCRRSANLIDYLEHISTKINDLFDVRVSRLEFFQHPLENFPIYDPDPPKHIDARYDFSGVLYLDTGAIGMGTTIGDQYVEWKPNRLVTFDALTYHCPHFGGQERKLLTFFSYKK
jgi:hypothetical protein